MLVIFEVNSDGGGHQLDPAVLIAVAVTLVVAKLGGELFERKGQPAVLGELVGGIALSAFALIGGKISAGVDFLRGDAVIATLAEIGVVILLFEVGLESKVSDLFAVGLSSLLVAVAGVVAPFLLGWGAAAYFMPAGARLEHIFIGAILCATSVGITARVLKDLRKLDAPESRIILGAAVIDDVLGLIVLAVVAGMIEARAAGETLAILGVVLITLKAFGFLIGAALLGRFVAPRLFGRASRLRTRGVLLTFAVAFCLALAWAASLVGLAPIIGAFAAGLILEEKFLSNFYERGVPSLERMLSPVSALFVPIFFVVTGARVDLRSFAQPRIFGFAAALTLAAIIGKQVCSLAVLERGVNRLAIGVGMIPRGEVGLIFAGVGASLMLKNERGESAPVVSAETFAAVVLMVIVTTLAAPPALKFLISRGAKRIEAATQKS